MVVEELHNNKYYKMLKLSFAMFGLGRFALILSGVVQTTLI